MKEKDKTVAAVAALLVAKGPDCPSQYNSIAKEIVAIVRGSNHEHAPEQEAQAVTLDRLKAEIQAICPDCREATRRAYSDATTPGFFFDICAHHRDLFSSRGKV